MRSSRRRAAFRHGFALVSCCALLFGVSPLLHAFFPTNLRTVGGLFGTSHPDMTAQAIRELDVEFFSPPRITGGMEKAIEQISEANTAVDEDQQTAAKHFDGESFPEGQQRLIALLGEVTGRLSGGLVGEARQSLGAALHAIQDFYSHSNWVELGNAAPHSGLGRPGSSITRLPSGTPTCQPCTGIVGCPDCSANLITGSLTSGYYGGESAPFNVKPAGKCTHGGLTDTLAAGFYGEGINKDGTICDFVPHHALHGAAVSVAMLGTKQFIRDIKDRVPLSQLKQLLGVGPSLAFAIDVSGSMTDAITGFRDRAKQIVDGLLDTEDEPSLYILCPFSDPGVGPCKRTSDPETFKLHLDGLSAVAGDDCPELAMSGALRAISELEEGGKLYLFTDASAKDSGLSAAVVSQAKKKKVRVNAMIFGSCSPLDPAYIELAEGSGGQVFVDAQSAAGNLTELVRFEVGSDAVEVLWIADSVAGTPKSYPVPVDSTMSRVSFSVSGASTVTVNRPDGSPIAGTDPGVTLVSLASGLLASVVDPEAGEWEVVVGGTASFTLAVSGESEVQLARFQFVEERGRPGHQGFFPIPGSPAAGQPGVVDARLIGSFDTAQFELRSRSGALLQSLDLSPVEGTTDEYSGALTPPGEPFLPYVRGMDAGGEAYQRVLAQVIESQSVLVTPPAARDLARNQTATYVFQVKNLGAPDTFDVQAVDDHPFLFNLSPGAVTLGTGEMTGVTVQLRPPSTATPGEVDNLILRVQSQSDTSIQNFAVVRSGIAGTSVSDIAPNSGPSAGGTALAVNGLGFAAGAGLTFAGGAPASGVTFVSSIRLNGTSPALPPGTLNDVNVINPDATAGALPEAWFADFLDTPQSHPFHDFVERLFRSRVTAGCGGGNYCPESSVTRGQMAVFILKAKNGPGYQPPPATGVFGDVPVGHIFARWIEQLSREGITAGCGGGNYCPDAPVTRGQMAVFLLKALFGSDFMPAPATGLFTDVPVSNPFARWIELLFAQKITSGCGAGLYCPAAANTRGQMAVFLSRTFLGVPTVTVNAPPAIARDHPAAGADFGPKPTLLGVTAGMSIAFDTAADFTDACQPLTPASAAAAAGKLLLVRRGGCSFVTQVKNGQNAGAVGVIVMDTVFGRLPGWMPGSDPTIAIPAVQVSRESGDAFIANSATINATLGVKLSGRAAARAAHAFSVPEGAQGRGPVVLPSLRTTPDSPGSRPPGQ